MLNICIENATLGKARVPVGEKKSKREKMNKHEQMQTRSTGSKIQCQFQEKNELHTKQNARK